MSRAGRGDQTGTIDALFTSNAPKAANSAPTSVSSFLWGEAFVFADHPDKPFDGEVGGEPLDTSVTYNLFEA